MNYSKFIFHLILLSFLYFKSQCISEEEFREELIEKEAQFNGSIEDIETPQRSKEELDMANNGIEIDYDPDSEIFNQSLVDSHPMLMEYENTSEGTSESREFIVYDLPHSQNASSGIVFEEFGEEESREKVVDLEEEAGKMEEEGDFAEDAEIEVVSEDPEVVVNYRNESFVESIAEDAGNEPEQDEGDEIYHRNKDLIEIEMEEASLGPDNAETEAPEPQFEESGELHTNAHILFQESFPNKAWVKSWNRYFTWNRTRIAYKGRFRYLDGQIEASKRGIYQIWSQIPRIDTLRQSLTLQYDLTSDSSGCFNAQLKLYSCAEGEEWSWKAFKRPTLLSMDNFDCVNSNRTFIMKIGDGNERGIWRDSKGVYTPNGKTSYKVVLKDNGVYDMLMNEESINYGYFEAEAFDQLKTMCRIDLYVVIPKWGSPLRVDNIRITTND